MAAENEKTVGQQQEFTFENEPAFPDDIHDIEDDDETETADKEEE